MSENAPVQLTLNPSLLPMLTEHYVKDGVVTGKVASLVDDTLRIEIVANDGLELSIKISFVGEDPLLTQGAMLTFSTDGVVHSVTAAPAASKAKAPRKASPLDKADYF